jgi:hypothetical protein
MHWPMLHISILEKLTLHNARYIPRVNAKKILCPLPFKKLAASTFLAQSWPTPKKLLATSLVA